MEKTKIFIRAVPGASMHFIGTVIWSLITDRDCALAINKSAYTESAEINQYHNFGDFWDHGKNGKEFNNYTSENIDLTQSINWMQRVIKFYPCPQNYYVAFVHAVNPDPVMMAFGDTKLINITHADSDLDQLAFNWLTKTGMNNLNALQKSLTNLQTKTGKLKNIGLESLDVHERELVLLYISSAAAAGHSTALKLLTYITKFSTLEHRQKFLKFQFLKDYPRFEIPFSEIANKKIIDRLDELINFIGVSVSNERKTAVIKLINDYADAQTPVPWKLTIDEYK